MMRLIREILDLRRAIGRVFRYALTALFAGYSFILHRVCDKRSILFNVVRENHYLMYAPLYERLSRDPRLNVYFTSPWEPQAGCKNPSRRLLEKYDISSDRIISPRQAYWRRWDICADVDYKITRTLWPVKRVQMFHGFSGKFRDGGRDGTIHQSISKYDALFCFSPTHEQMFINSGYLKKNCRTFCIGFPKLDNLICPEPTRETILRGYGANPDKRSILYAPSWNPQLSLNTIGEELIESFGNCGWTVMVKPHPMSLKTFGDITGYKRRDWHLYLSRLHRAGMIIYITDQNACHYLKAADILITDHGSTLYEYMILNRPILYYDTAQAASVMTMPEYLPKIRRVVFPFQTARDVLEIIKKDILTGRSDQSDIQEELIQFHFYDVGRAANRAIEAIYLLLKLNPLSNREVAG